MSETSKVVVLFTRDFGKVRLAARGARRPKSKFGASLEPMTLGSYVFYRREQREVQTLSEGDILYAFDNVKRDYARMAAGSAICELLDHMTEDEDRNPLLYRFALDALRWVGEVPLSALDVPIWYFQLKAAGELGYRPHLSGCVQCGNRLDERKIGFSPMLGGTLCASHAGNGMQIARGTVDFLAHLQAGRPDRIELARLATTNRAETNRAIRSFLDLHIESRYRPRAMDFYDRLRAAEQSVSYQTQEGA